jgi:hypothetical protein
VCNKVSTAAISAIVGYPVPSGIGSASTIPASKTFDVSSNVTICTYGNGYGDAAVSAKVVTLTGIVFSKAVKLSTYLKQFSSTLGVKCTPYSGLGAPGIYCAANSSSGSPQREILGDIAGRFYFAADVFTKVIPLAKVAALARLSQNFYVETTQNCPTAIDVFDAWRRSPGIDRVSSNVKVKGFSTPACWKNWVFATPIANPQGNGYFTFSVTGTLHGVSSAELSQLDAQVCAQLNSSYYAGEYLDDPGYCQQN